MLEPFFSIDGTGTYSILEPVCSICFTSSSIHLLIHLFELPIVIAWETDAHHTSGDKPMVLFMGSLSVDVCSPSSYLGCFFYGESSVDSHTCEGSSTKGSPQTKIVAHCALIIIPFFQLILVLAAWSLGDT